MSLQGAPRVVKSRVTLIAMVSQPEPLPEDIELPVFRLVRGPTAVQLSDTQLVIADSGVN